MIFNTDVRPKSVTLMRLGQANGRFIPPSNLADVVPLLDAAVADARQWRPDLTTGQTWTFSASVPKSPLASGATATNHVRRQPVTLSFEAMVTNTPMVPFGGIRGAGGIRRADALWAALRAMYESRTFVAVVAPVAIIENALIENLVLTRTPEDGSAYFFSIDIVEQQTYELRLLPNIEDAQAQNGAALTQSGGLILGGI
jgi:hypothetical protein